MLIGIGLAAIILGASAAAVYLLRIPDGDPHPDAILGEGTNPEPPGTASRGDDLGQQPGIHLPPENGQWQWQLTGLPVDLSHGADIYDIDSFDNGPEVVGKLQAEGRYLICYLNVGSWEDWRPDAGAFPEGVLGKDYQGWPGERWLDIRQIALIGPLLQARLDLCQEKGFDGVEPDNQDGYQNDTGFPLTYQDQLAFNIWLANEAHQRGLSIGLKNDADQAADLVGHYDWALAEDCFAGGWCQDLAVFRAAGKAVLAAEYTDQMTQAEFLARVCPRAQELGFSAILKDRDLGAWRLACP